MTFYQIALGIIIPLALLWVLFRYLIRLVKSVESIADSFEEVTASIKEISEKIAGNEETGNQESKE